MDVLRPVVARRNTFVVYIRRRQPGDEYELARSLYRYHPCEKRMLKKTGRVDPFTFHCDPPLEGPNRRKESGSAAYPCAIIDLEQSNLLGTGSCSRTEDRSYPDA